MLCGSAACCVDIGFLKADWCERKGILVSELGSRMLRGVLVAASLSHEVLGLRIVALARAALTQGWRGTAILLGAVKFEHVLHKTHKSCSAVAMIEGVVIAFLMCCWGGHIHHWRKPTH